MRGEVQRDMLATEGSVIGENIGALEGGSAPGFAP
jgi:hypothetical protein